MPKKYLLHTNSYGTGAPVVLLHGYLASSAYWDMLAQLLATNHRVITVDLLGFGMSPKPRTSTYDYSAQIASLNYTLEKLAITQPFILVGHSMGSLLALRYGRLFAHKVKKLVLLNMPIMMNKKEVEKEIYGISIAFRLGLGTLTHNVMWSLFKLLHRCKLLPKKLSAALNDRLAYVFQNSGRSRLRSFRNVIAGSDIQLDLATISVPTMLIHGARDRPLYLHNIAQLPVRSNIINKVINGGHHLPHSATTSLEKIMRSF